MSATWTMTDANNTNMTAYIAMRLAQDGIVVSIDESVAELLARAGIPRTGGGTSHGTPAIKTHGNYFHIL